MLSNAVINVAYSTRYFYQVSDANGVCTSPVYNFTSPPGAALPLPLSAKIIWLKTSCMSALIRLFLRCATQLRSWSALSPKPTTQFDACPRAAAPATFPQRGLVIADLGMLYKSSTTMQHVFMRPPRQQLASDHADVYQPT